MPTLSIPNLYDLSLLFDEDKRCKTTYPPEIDKDFLPTYISNLKLSRISRRPVNQFHGKVHMDDCI